MRLDIRQAVAKHLSLVVLGAAALLAGCVTLPTPSPNYTTGNRLVFPTVATGPALNGGAGDDTIWSTGFRYVMEDGGAFPAATFRGLADATNVYILAKVEDANFSESDVVVIAFNPTNTASGYHRLHIFPCVLPMGGGCTDNGLNTTPNVLYSSGTGSGVPITVAWGASNPSPAGIQAISRTTTGMGGKTWEVQVRIARATYGFLDTNFFGLFVDVVRTDPFAGIAGEAVQYTWPPNQFIGSGSENDVLSQLDSTLPPADWGNATLSKLFASGVRLDNLGTNHPSDPNLIRLNAGNVFHATAANYSSSAGTLVTAQNVTATFTIANNGLPSLATWGNVPVGNNPTGAIDIAPTVAHTFLTGTWNLTATEVTQYTANPAQCVRVTLTSDDPATVFTNPTTMRNMHFVQSSSPFRERAFVNARGYEPPRGERTVAYTLREQFVNFDPKLEWTSKIENATVLRPRLYRANAAPNAELALGITVEPPRMVLPKDTVRIPAGTGGAARPATIVPVRPGEILTFIASGTVGIAGQSLTAAGGAVADRRGEPRLRGAAPIGAVVGSFDGFKESAFVVGSAATLKVPADANELQLKINDDPQQYGKQEGEGFVLELVRTAAEPWMVAANPELARAVRGDDVFVTLGANLPTWLLRGERDTGRVIVIAGKPYRVFESVGSFGYMVKTIR